MYMFVYIYVIFGRCVYVGVLAFYPWKSEQGIECHGVGDISSCKLLNMGAGN